MFKRFFLGAVALAAFSMVFSQDSTTRTPTRRHAKTVVAKGSKVRLLRAALAPSDFPIAIKAYDSTPGSVLVISKSARGAKQSPLYTKALENEQVASVVSWQNTERTHFGFLVLTTPSEGNLYNVLFFLYHDGKLSIPIDDVATGYPVIPSIRRTDKSGQIQIAFDDGSGDATNDKVKTVVLYTWSDYSHRFVKNVHQVAAESVERPRSRVEKTRAADDNGN